MGYYTDFTLTFDAEIEEFEQALEALKEEGKSSYLEDFEFGNNEGVLNAKWCYGEYIQEIAALSLKMPGKLIELNGIGEDYTDIWTLFAKDGKVRHKMAEIVYPVFNEEELITVEEELAL